MGKYISTPEEKLLKIIENPELAKAPVPIKNNQLKNIKVFDLMQKAKSKEFLNIHSLNMFMIGVCIILSGVTVFDFFKIRVGLHNRIINLKPELSSFKIPVNDNADVTIDAVLSQTKKRNMFNALTAHDTGKAAAVVDTAADAANFKLVGIIWQENPQVMIEDIKGQKTYCVGEGEQVGAIKIKKISQDKVLVRKDESEWEMR